MGTSLYDIETLLDEVVTLPSMPDVVLKVTELINQPDCSLGEVGKVISTDPAIAFKMFRLVNSAYYGLRQEVTSVEHATVLLGAKVIRNLVLSATVFEAIGGATEVYLRHCVACGVAMKALCAEGPLAEHLGSPDEAFIYGLIHDIGKVFFEEFMPDQYDEVAAMTEQEGISCREAELRVIGVDHAELGLRLAEKWRLSEPIINAVGGHHDLNLCADEYHTLAATLGVADYLVGACGMPASASIDCHIDPQMFAVAELTGDRLVAGVNRFFESVGQVDELMNLAD